MNMRHLRRVTAMLNFSAAVGFFTAYLIGGYSTFATIAGLWLSIGLLNVAIDIRQQKIQQ